ncbi:serine/threonine protein kinase [Tilletia horrida]|nr:serine/threonine protein kinase [Tilletia horrida]
MFAQTQTLTQSEERKRKLLLDVGLPPIGEHEHAAQHEPMRSSHSIYNAQPNALSVLPGEVARLATVDSSGHKHILRLQHRAIFTIGRAPDSDYILTSPKASRKHARIIPLSSDEHVECYVFWEDISRRGVLINGVKVDRTYMLTDGDQITTGGQTFTFRYVQRDEASAPTPAQAQGATPLPYQVPRELRITETLGSISVTNKVLGTGTYGHVFLGYTTHPRGHKQVAVKKQTKYAEKGRSPAKWSLELQLLISMRHPNINRCLETFESETHMYVALELFQIDLHTYIVQWGGVHIPAAKFIFFQLFNAVKYLHDRGICHRDIKPENIYLESAASDFPRICLGDFGAAYKVSLPADGGPVTRSSLRAMTICGTIDYLAPEIFTHSVSLKGYDPRAMDMWSCGVTLFFAVSAFHPFDQHGRTPKCDIMPQVVQMELDLDDATVPVQSNNGIKAGKTADQDAQRRDVVERASVNKECFASSPSYNEDDVIQRDEMTGQATPIGPAGREQSSNPSDHAALNDGGAAAANNTLQEEREYVRNILQGRFADMPEQMAYDPAGQDLIRRLIETNSKARLTARQALLHEWFNSAQPALMSMYQHRVLGWTEDKLAQLQQKSAKTGAPRQA